MFHLSSGRVGFDVLLSDAELDAAEAALANADAAGGEGEEEEGPSGADDD
jgi:hypothetical protein